MKEIIIEQLDFSEQDKVFIETHGKDKMLICIADILFFDCAGNYSTIYLKNGNEIIDRVLLKHWDLLLTKHGFLRIDNGILVNGRYITVIDLESKEKKCFLGEITLKFSRRRANLLKNSKILLPHIPKNNRL